jgi:hypothetical protein
MPGSEIDGKHITQPEANKASNQDADAKFKDKIGDIDRETQQKYANIRGGDDKASGNERSNLDAGNLKGSD